MLCPLSRQGQVSRTLGPRKSIEVLPRDILKCRPTDSFANNSSDQLSLRDNTEPDGIVQEAEKVVLSDATTDAFSERVSLWQQ